MAASSPEEAERFGELLLQKRLVACTNLSREMKSIFYWLSSLDQPKEHLMLAKTMRDHPSVIQQLLSGNHSYDCPYLLALLILGGNLDFLNWIKEETYSQELGG